MAEKRFYSVDIDENCKGQEFTVSRETCFITGLPIIMANGMGLYQLTINSSDSDEVIISELLATVNCVPMSIRKVE